MPPQGGVADPTWTRARRPGGVDIANVAADKAMVASRATGPGFTKVTAPVSGRVSRYLVTVGNLIQSADQANVTLLTTIVSVDPMYAYFDVDERTVQRVRQWIREGKAESARDVRAARVRSAWPTRKGFPTEGTINFVDNQVNPKTGTLRVRGVFPNKDEALSPGFFARVRVPIGPPHKALLVSDRAIDTDQGQKIVYVVNDKNEVVSRPVRLGALHDGLRAIEDGLKAGRAGDRQRPATGSAGHHRRAEARGHADLEVRDRNQQIRRRKSERPKTSSVIVRLASDLRTLTR